MIVTEPIEGIHQLPMKQIRKEDSRVLDFAEFVGFAQPSSMVRDEVNTTKDIEDKSNDELPSDKCSEEVSNKSEGKVESEGTIVKEGKGENMETTESSEEIIASVEHRREGNPDSGQGELAKLASTEERVGGKGNGVRPGASTEATANTHILFDSNIPQKTTSERKLNEITPPEVPHPQNVNETESIPKRTEISNIKKNTFAKMSARFLKDSLEIGIKYQNYPVERQAVFTTGLAEHIVRLLTDKFDELFDQNNHINLSVGKRLPPVSSIETLPNSNLQTNLLSLLQTDDISANEIIDRTINIIRTNVGLRNSRTTIQLEPPELGRMQINVRLTNNDLHISILTETNRARHILTARSDILRNALEQQGINLVRLEISQELRDNPNATRSESHQYSRQHGRDFHHQGNGYRNSRQGNNNKEKEQW